MDQNMFLVTSFKPPRVLRVAAPSRETKRVDLSCPAVQRGMAFLVDPVRMLLSALCSWKD